MFDKTSYTTERSVVSFCKEYIDQNGVCNKTFKPYKFRPDFISTDKNVVVEFDGYQHYTNPETIIRDYAKDRVLTQQGFNVVRIPYFVQLDKIVMNELFQPYISVEPFDFTVYPQGFIDKKATLPSYFCSLGVERFINDLSRFWFIEHLILTSLQIKIAEKGDWRLVYPASLNK